MREDKNWGTARPETFVGVDLATEPDFSVEMVSMPKEEYDRLTAAERENSRLRAQREVTINYCVSRHLCPPFKPRCSPIAFGICQKCWLDWLDESTPKEGEGNG